MEVGRQHAPPPANRAVRNGKIGVQLRRFYEPKMKGKLTRGCAPKLTRQGALCRNMP